MRRKQGTGLVKNEIRLLQVAAAMEADKKVFYGYDLVHTLVRPRSRKPLMSQPTLYRTLRRLEESGHLSSEWESLASAEADGRDGRPRRYYRLTAAGRRAAVKNARPA